MISDRVIVSVLAVAFLLAACGSDATTSEEAPNPDASVDITPYLLDPDDPNRDDYVFVVPVDAWPVEAVIDLGVGPSDADAAIALAVARGRADGVPMLVEEFDACAPVAAWVVESSGDPTFDWAQGFIDCVAQSPYAAVYPAVSPESAS